MKTRVTLTLDRSLKAVAKALAARDGVSLNRYVADAVAQKLGSGSAAAFFAERGKGGDTARAIALLEGRSE